MRILAVSDSHHDLSCLAFVLRRQAAKVDMIAHAGDGAEDVARIAQAAKLRLPRVESVRGNGDYEPNLPYRLLFGGAERPILMLHGHREGVSEGPYGIIAAASGAGAKLVIFGHTHRPFFEEYHGILALNPGSISRPRGRDHPTFAIVDVPEESDKWFDVQFYEVDRGFGRIRRIEVV
jgi:putative phosphoesterase